jgi:restriction system protein
MKRLWVVRAGKFGEREDAALASGRLQPGFEDVPELSGRKGRDAILEILRAALPNDGQNRLRNFAAQLNQFVNTIEAGDLVVMPLKQAPQIAIAHVVGDYAYDPKLGHTRPVEWLRADAPRDAFKQDLLHSFGAFLTICEVKRNNAYARTLAVAKGKVDRGPVNAGATPAKPDTEGGETDDESVPINLDTLARDQIREHVAATFAGHDLTRLIAAVLQSEGYTVNVAPAGPDEGVDIVAGRGPLGFEAPRLVVQCKSGTQVADLPTLNGLIGSVTNLGADYGLLVSWSGFTQPVRRKVNDQFFKIRLWSSDDVLEAVFRAYERLPEEIRKSLPLKRTWTLVLDEAG